ncbi:MAG: glutathione gamma-glutamylcysteinyltransferase, partial [Parachlamydiaceae bacterium]|nr:glutathione gamma-glutamylcysteinyltransferase [Parachlamydiaceae bacterium]
PNQTVIALYYRKALKQDGTGHWSPVAAYDHESDSFLILDVARYKYPPAWVSGKAFITGMKSLNHKGLSRGFIILDNSKNN